MYNFVLAIIKPLPIYAEGLNFPECFQYYCFFYMSLL